MSNEIMIFRNDVFSDVRTVMIDDEPWFAATDITRILGYKNCSKAIADHVDEEDKGITKCSTSGGMQNLTVINESGVYSLIIQSKMPDARRFKRWVTSEILPTIRKTGGYVFDEEAYARRLLSSQSEEVIMNFTAALKALSRASDENNTVEHNIR